MQSLSILDVKEHIEANGFKVNVKNPNDLPLIDYRTLVEFQGELKELDQDDYDKLLISIVENGFFLPFFVWEFEGQHLILDGHQRFRILNNEEATPYDFPYLKIEAETYAEAKQKLLLITSHFGKITDEGLKAFTLELDQSWVNSRTSFTGIKPLNLDLKRDLLPVPTDQADAPATETKGGKPSASHNGYAMYETLMPHQDKVRFINVLDDILHGHGYVTQAEAIMHLVELYEASVTGKPKPKRKGKKEKAAADVAPADAPAETAPDPVAEPNPDQPSI